LDEESTQEVSGPLATEESEDGPIGRTMFRSRHLTPKHSHLMGGARRPRSPDRSRHLSWVGGT